MKHCGPMNKQLLNKLAKKKQAVNISKLQPQLLNIGKFEVMECLREQ